jgi:hypothetical protein
MKMELTEKVYELCKSIENADLSLEELIFLSEVIKKLYMDKELLK